MAQENAMTFKGRPLVRCKNEFYYGSMSDKFIVFMRILSTKEQNSEQIADRVLVQLLSTDTSLGPRARIIKSSDKSGIYNALDIGSIWLERALAE